MGRTVSEVSVVCAAITYVEHVISLTAVERDVKSFHYQLELDHAWPVFVSSITSILVERRMLALKLLRLPESVLSTSRVGNDCCSRLEPGLASYRWSAIVRIGQSVLPPRRTEA